MKLNEENVLKIAHEFLKNKAYTNPMLGHPYFEPFDSKRNLEPVDCWIVSIIYRHLGKEESSYLFVEDKTGNVMYLLTGNGREFPGGVQ